MEGGLFVSPDPIFIFYFYIVCLIGGLNPKEKGAQISGILLAIT